MRRGVTFASAPSVYLYAPYAPIPAPSAGQTAYSAAPLYTPGGHQGFFASAGVPVGGSPGLSLNLGQNYAAGGGCYSAPSSSPYGSAAASPALAFSCSAPGAWGSAPSGFPGLSIRAPTYAQPALTQSEYYARTVTAAEAYRGSACAPGYSGGAEAAQRAAEAAQRQQALAQAYSSYYSGLPNLPSSP